MVSALNWYYAAWSHWVVAVLCVPQHSALVPREKSPVGVRCRVFFALLELCRSCESAAG
jgi:hypothetical protein